MFVNRRRVTGDRWIASRSGQGHQGGEPGIGLTAPGHGIEIVYERSGYDRILREVCADTQRLETGVQEERKIYLNGLRKRVGHLYSHTLASLVRMLAWFNARRRGPT